MNPETRIAVIGVDYDEGRISSYRGIIVGDHLGPWVRFNTSDAKSDYKDALAWCSAESCEAYNSSTVNNFKMDWGQIE